MILTKWKWSPFPRVHLELQNSSTFKGWRIRTSYYLRITKKGLIFNLRKNKMRPIPIFCRAQKCAMTFFRVQNLINSTKIQFPLLLRVLAKIDNNPHVHININERHTFHIKSYYNSLHAAWKMLTLWFSCWAFPFWTCTTWITNVPIDPNIGRFLLKSWNKSKYIN